MGIFDSIKNAIFGSAEASETAQPTPSKPVAAPEQPAATVAPAAGEAPPVEVDVAAILDAAVAKAGQKLDWRHSIVDMMKALGLDSSLGARRELAGELNYQGDTSDTATMNMWLHKELMQKLRQNGGKVPDDLTA